MRHCPAFPPAALTAAALAALSATSAKEARAAGVDALFVQGAVAAADLGTKDLGEVEEDPSVLVGQHVVLAGTGRMMDVGIRGVTQSREGYRFGLGAGYFETEGLRLKPLDMPPGLGAVADSIWGASFEFSLGRAFPGLPVQPYIDLRLVANVVHVDIEFSSDAHGTLGKSGFDGVSMTVGPRMGIFIPMGDTVCIDISGTYGLFGMERAGVTVGLGVWDGILDDDDDDDS